MTTKLFLGMFLAAVAILPASAEIGRYYTFEPSTGVFTTFTGTYIPELQANDAISAQIDIGFSFPYANGIYTTVKIGSNGWINPGATAQYSYPGNSLTSYANTMIAPLWDDLSLVTGNVQYQITGEAPNRCFRVQFYHARWNLDAANAWYDFQAELHENGLVRFIYGPGYGTPCEPSASIGMNTPPGGHGNYYSITPGNPPTVSSYPENWDVAEYPGNGTVYSFVPMPPVLYDLQVTAFGAEFYQDISVPFNCTVKVKNLATLSSPDYEVVVRDGDTELTRITGVTLNPNQEYTYVLNTTAGESGYRYFTAQAELSSDEYPNDNARTFIGIVRPDPDLAIMFGEGGEWVRIPLDIWWKYSLDEMMYYPGEIDSTGMIYGISFFNSFTVDDAPLNVKLWIGESTLPDLSQGWIPASQLTEVFDHELLIPMAFNEIYIPFDQPYHYQGQNLVIMAYQDHYFYCGGEQYFDTQDLPEIRNLKHYTDTAAPDPDNPGNINTQNGITPRIAFYMTPASAVEDEVIPIPVLSAYPNPFRDNTTFRLENKAGSATEIMIYNLKGQLVRKLCSKDNQLQWDGCDEQGKHLAAGIYLAKVMDGKKPRLQKLCLLK